MLKHCRELNNPALPDAHAAYLEACRAPSPKSDFHWSHPAVYFAGKAADWFFLQNNSEAIAFPVFKLEYEKWVKRAIDGEQLTIQKAKQIDETPLESLSKQENSKRLADLKKNLDF